MWHWILHFILIGSLILFSVDWLTGLWVRRVYSIAYRIIVWSKGWMIFIDLDNFKLINDKCGHRVGDRALKRIGSILRRTSKWRAFRYGGDEFAVLLPWASKEKALQMGEEIRRGIENAVMMKKGAENGEEEGVWKITASCVVCQSEEAVKEILSSIKKNGRNQTRD